MLKRKLFKTATLAGLAVVCPNIAKGNIFGVTEFNNKEANAVLFYHINQAGKVDFLQLANHNHCVNRSTHVLLVKTKVPLQDCTTICMTAGVKGLSPTSLNLILQQLT